MLVFISDLHFVDNTAGKHNLPPAAFDGVFRDLSDHAGKAKAQDIKIIFLGDIFDILRTEEWFKFDAAERPWGTDELRIEDHAKSIFDKIISQNEATFNILKGSLKDAYGFSNEPERIYIPGNHDRLCNKYESLRAIIRENMGIKGKQAGEKFDHFYSNPDYNVLARHGHEFDVYNYEGGADYSFDAHTAVPIGDPITTELVAKLPWAIKHRLQEKNLPVDIINRIYENFQDIENVRPLSATIDWLLYRAQTYTDLRNIIEEVIEKSIDSVVTEFEKLPFVQNWYEKHDRWFPILDEADRIQFFLSVLKRFKFEHKDRILVMAERLNELWPEKDKYIQAAIREYSSPADSILYVVYGHTHEPMQSPIQVVDSRQQVYFNTGTWRARHRRCEQGNGFITWKNLTYVIFYNPEESKLPHPTFETWTGSLKDD